MRPPRLIDVYQTHLVLKSRQEVREKCHQGEMSFMPKVTDPSRKQAFVNVGISIFRNSNLGERIGQQDYLHFQKKKNWVEKESTDRNPILQNEGFNQFPFFLLFKYLYRYFESGPTDSNFVWIRLLPSQSANKFRP